MSNCQIFRVKKRKLPHFLATKMPNCQILWKSEIAQYLRQKCQSARFPHDKNAKLLNFLTGIWWICQIFTTKCQIARFPSVKRQMPNCQISWRQKCQIAIFLHGKIGKFPNFLIGKSENDKYLRHNLKIIRFPWNKNFV